jgi:hypothetical protein
MAWVLSVMAIPAAFPSRPKRRDSLTSGLDGFPFYCLFNVLNKNSVNIN